MVTALFAFGIAYHQQFFGLNSAPSSGPARDVALPGGGVSDGSHCGAKGYHYFPVSAVTDTGGMLPGTPAGPAAVLGANGTEIPAHSPGDFTFTFSLNSGSPSRSLILDVAKVGQALNPPYNAHNTITGQPPYTLTISVSDPAVTALRRELNSTATGPVLAANNLVN